MTQLQARTHARFLSNGNPSAMVAVVRLPTQIEQYAYQSTSDDARPLGTTHLYKSGRLVFTTTTPVMGLGRDDFRSVSVEVETATTSEVVA